MILSLPSDVHWTPRVFKTLASAATTCTNFKVKIGAVGAFCAPRELAQFGGEDESEHVVRMCIDALGIVSKTMDSMLSEGEFGERSYKEQLEVAIRAGLDHFKALGCENDIESALGSLKFV